jgi:hypothetical protein
VKSRLGIRRIVLPLPWDGEEMSRSGTEIRSSVSPSSFRRSRPLSIERRYSVRISTLVIMVVAPVLDSTSTQEYQRRPCRQHDNARLLMPRHRLRDGRAHYGRLRPSRGLASLVKLPHGGGLPEEGSRRPFQATGRGSRFRASTESSSNHRRVINRGRLLLLRPVGQAACCRASCEVTVWSAGRLCAPALHEQSGLVAWIALRSIEVDADLVIGLNGGAKIYLLQPQGPM